MLSILKVLGIIRHIKIAEVKKRHFLKIHIYQTYKQNKNNSTCFQKKKTVTELKVCNS